MTKCKTCKKEVRSGIWFDSQFKENPPLLFCSEKCRQELIKDKLKRIKEKYLSYYEKVMKKSREEDLGKYVL